MATPVKPRSRAAELLKDFGKTFAVLGTAATAYGLTLRPAAALKEAVSGSPVAGTLAQFAALGAALGLGLGLPLGLFERRAGENGMQKTARIAKGSAITAGVCAMIMGLVGPLLKTPPPIGELFRHAYLP